MNDALKRIDLQIMWNRLIAVVEERTMVLLRGCAKEKEWTRCGSQN